MTTITQGQYERMAETVQAKAWKFKFEDAKNTVDDLLRAAGITVEEPPYVPSKSGELFVDGDGDVWEVSHRDPSEAYELSMATDVDYLQEHYGPLTPYVKEA